MPSLHAPGVREALVKALADAGVAELTPIQTGVLPHVLAGSDVLAKAKTGTGKTFAFLVPTVERLLRSDAAALPGGVDPVRALVLSSARELGNQIASQAEKLTAGLSSFTTETIMGGSSITPQRERLDPILVGSSCKYGGRIDLMIATPGRLIEHLNTTAGFAARLAGCELLILDECDQLLDGGFQQDIETIVAVLPTTRQTLCFSATVPEKMLDVLGLAMRAAHVTVDCVGDAPPSHALIAQTVVVHSLERSLLALYASIRAEMLSRPTDYKILAFLPTARQASFCTAMLEELGLDVLQIHSRRTATERTAASDTFRQKTQQVLLSSDVSARGVDYPDVTLVLQVGAPSSRDIYVQRVGRTGRAGRAGAATLLLCAYEQGFMTHLEGLPIKVVQSAGATAEAAEIADLARVREAAARVPDELATQTYRAWIVAMNGQRKALKWSKTEIVANANLYAREVLGRSVVPTLPKKTAVEHGLLGLAGLTIDDSPSASDVAAEAAAAAAAAEAAAPAYELAIKFDWPAFCRVLRKDAGDAKAAVVALGDEAAMALQATLDQEGEAEVGGYRIVAGMVSVSMVERQMAISRSSSAVSLDRMTRVASATSIASTTTASEDGSVPGTSLQPSRTGSARDLEAIGEATGEAPVHVNTAHTPSSKKKASKEEIKAATDRMAAAGMALKEATAAGKGVKEAQAALAAAKEAKNALTGGKGK